MGDARRLLARAMGINSGRWSLHLDDLLSAEQMVDFQAFLDRRRARQPVSQILGRRDFFGRSFRVTPDVLDPRPETETLVARALEMPWTRVLDLGTGSGCILVTLLAERTEATGVGADLSELALAVAERNAKALGVVEQAAFQVSNWFEGVSGRFDLIVSNPPYIADTVYADLDPEVRDWEPELALRAGPRGLDAYRPIVANSMDYLTSDGRLLLEIGWDQGQSVADLLLSAGFSSVTIHPDFDGRDRVIEGCRRV
jgi:release factor glutamine methyltransferase